MIDRYGVREALLRWQRGHLTEREIHEQMEALWEQHEWPQLSETADDSIAIEAVMKLDALNVEWVTRDDIPAFLEFLSTPGGHAAEGWEKWRSYWDSVDMARREEEVRSNAYYSRARIS